MHQVISLSLYQPVHVLILLPKDLHEFMVYQG